MFLRSLGIASTIPASANYYSALYMSPVLRGSITSFMGAFSYEDTFLEQN